MLSDCTNDVGGWALLEDRPGKPAWMSTGPNGSAIDFELRFGESPRLTIVFDRSYERFGSAIATIGDREPVRLLGLRDDGVNVTQTDVVVLDVKDRRRLQLPTSLPNAPPHVRGWAGGSGRGATTRSGSRTPRATAPSSRLGSCRRAELTSRARAPD